MELRDMKRDTSEILKTESDILDLELELKLKKELLKRELDESVKVKVVSIERGDHSDIDRICFIPLTETGERIISSIPKHIYMGDNETLYKDIIPQVKTLKEGIDYQVFNL